MTSTESWQHGTRQAERGAADESRPAIPAGASLVIHAHFYQPPRENPFLDEVETELSAAPFHDWNQRIERECYRAVVAARVTGAGGRISRIVNTLEWMSFNVGSTLLEWMEQKAPDTYMAILAADRASIQRLGYGNAIAQPYHHSILPLASRRDKQTEVRWGITDFRRRFGREPQGMWLPETAVDDETLDVLAAEGIGFTILAPHQVSVVAPGGRPLRYRTSNGREITLCTYHGPLSHGIAFGGLLHDSEKWVAQMKTMMHNLSRGTRHASQTLDENDAAAMLDTANVLEPGPVLLSAATDGETYGHHHRFGEMALARALERMHGYGARVENFAAFIARHPAEVMTELVAPSAWSCSHGVERWRSDCGCRMDGSRNPSQAWRTPLRLALDELAEGLHAIFEREGAALFRDGDVWRTRDAYGAIVANPETTLAEVFVREYLAPSLPPEAIVRARELLELERDTLRMFTSCAWFFDDVGGLEPRQVLRYAARAIALAGRDAGGDLLEERLLARLDQALSNDRTVGTGRDVYLAEGRSRYPAPLRLAAAAAGAEHVQVHHPIIFAAGSVTRDGAHYVVRERRTGREFRYRVDVQQVRAGDIRFEVHAAARAGGAPAVLHLSDLPEEARLEIRSVLRRRLLPRCLTPSELDHLAAGDLQLRGVIATALVRAVRRLLDPADAEAAPLVHDLLDLLEQVETKVPFDVQTEFWTVWQSADATRRRSLASLRWRLGFVEDLANRDAT